MSRTKVLALAVGLLLVAAVRADIPLPKTHKYVDPRVRFEGIDTHADYVFYLRYLTFTGGPSGVPHTTVEVNGKRFDVKLWVPETAGVAIHAAHLNPTTARKPARSAASAGGGSGEVTVPMQGTIVKILVQVGERIEAGQPVVVLEAMKMENQIQAERSGSVAEIKVSAGETVGAGDVVVVIGD